jgi:hypothetical protein
LEGEEVTEKTPQTVFSKKESIARLRQALTDVEAGEKTTMLPRDLRTALETLDEAVRLLKELRQDGGCHVMMSFCLEHDVNAPGGFCSNEAAKKFLKEMD